VGCAAKVPWWRDSFGRTTRGQVGAQSVKGAAVVAWGQLVAVLSSGLCCERALVEGLSWSYHQGSSSGSVCERCCSSSDLCLLAHGCSLHLKGRGSARLRCELLGEPMASGWGECSVEVALAIW
jgi:hypothetical protein